MKNELTAVGRVIKHLRNHVAAEGLTPGSSLPSESQLSGILGVSRPIVREAMRSLATSGLIHVANGKRATVAAPDSAKLSLVIDNALLTSHADTRDILEMCRGLEITMAGLAAQRRTREHVTELRRLVAAFGASSFCSAEYAALDSRFHKTLAQAADNPFYPLLVEAFHQVYERSMLKGLENSSAASQPQKVQELQRAIVDAVDDRDPERASAAMARYFDHAVAAIAG